ncbi:MAG: hypothetical protein M3R55_16385, partial [Acidobacteriota bacterium]|nr:hypothetical protein [Acidobacteriota bacterium]
MSHIDAGGDPNSIRAGRELADVSPSSLVRQLVYLTIVCVVVWLSMVGMFKLFMGQLEQRDGPVSALARPAGEVPPGPRLLTDEPGALSQFRAREAATLDHYGWTDQAGGKVHIPIDRAKELLLQHGLPAREAGATPAPSVP